MPYRCTGILERRATWTFSSAPRVRTPLGSITPSSPSAPRSRPSVSEADFQRNDVVVQLGVPPRRIDVLTEIRGVTFEEAWRGRRTVEWGSRSVAFLGLEELLRNKRACGRAKDLMDVEALEKLHHRKQP